MKNKPIGFIFILLVLGSITVNSYAQNGSKHLIQRGLENLRHEKYGRAFQCFLAAAQAGNVDGQYYAGYCYLTAQGVLHNDAKALEWFQKAADQGDARAERSIGNIYEYGWSVNPDLAMARQWYQKAAQHNDVAAKNALERLDSEASKQNAQPTATPVDNGPAPIPVTQSAP